VSTVIPLGPFHPALEEPYKIEVTCTGERITAADITVGFNFRGIEWLAERKTSPCSNASAASAATCTR